ncbi:glycoside hydrolase family 18 protein [Apiospora kogelbergensis]|uniref:chitinase n=1 Tax=Apiospora kogelbergensis TaxID=1337665 RepID=A0AAW0QKH1_9PEZI
MCGKNSENGAMRCGMNLCCSASGFCGTTDLYCVNADPAGKTAPCQAGFGSCQTYPYPSCQAGSGNINHRTIGYYQSGNVRNRKCNQVRPKQIRTTGYTHMFYAFSSFDPKTFQVRVEDNDDVAMMKEFTGLSMNSGPQTWIAIGGLISAPPRQLTLLENRAAFISSLKTFMDMYGFTGVDLDWEYPGDPPSGGRKLQDTRNFPLLLQEMRAAYPSNYGISMTLPPDYAYLQWFDAKAMEQYVDFFNFMSYDLHTAKETQPNGKTQIKGQTDISEIKTKTQPLWFAGLNPAKINFGLAAYGRGYTLADPSCNRLLCPFSGPSIGGPCTNTTEGVISLAEIKALIQDQHLTPKYLSEQMMKQITWGNQWIGYDDEETFAAKKAWADGLCFGGSFVWSVDFETQ